MSESSLNEAEVLAPASKGGRTRVAILDAAARLFSERGYDGTGIRDIEDAAGVNRGVVTYHFGNKEEIWKAAAEHVFSPYLREIESKRELILALEPAARRRFLISHFVRTSAQRPEMNKLMIQENLAGTWRIDWIVEHFLRPLAGLRSTLSGDDPLLRRLDSDPHFRYILLGACNLVFSLPREVDALFGRDVFDDGFIERHIEAVLNLFEHSVAR